VCSRLALVPAVLGGILAPTAAAQQFWANVISWSPNVVRPGEPVSVVLTLRAYHVQDPNFRADGRRDVAVVIRGNGRTRRFATTPLGSGRYRATIVFPEAGAWSLRARYPGGETVLGKGAACVGDCADVPGMRRSSATAHPRLPVGLAIAGGVVLAAAVLVTAARRRRDPPG
jgi:hypothetical protein